MGTTSKDNVDVSLDEAKDRLWGCTLPQTFSREQEFLDCMNAYDASQEDKGTEIS